MKKLCLLMVCSTLHIQQIHSMYRPSQELTTEINNENQYGYEIVFKKYEDKPSITFPTETNPYSEKLYDDNITENDIESLVKQGAIINYKTKSWQKPWSIPQYYAFNGTEQGVKNMKKIIALGAVLHNFPNENSTPLIIAIDKNHNEMIQLLMPYEKPAVTIYQDEESKANSLQGRTVYSGEKKIRDHIISQSFSKQNINSIKLLLKLNLMSPNRGLKEFTYCMKPNQEILNLLMESGATNAGKTLDTVASDAFPNDTYIAFFEQLCISGASDEETLERMVTIQTKINGIVQALESNETIKQPKTKKEKK